MEPIIKMVGITKSFQRNVANSNVNFDLYKGEIHALVGENGAGKSTLMSILYGLQKSDSGSIFIEGVKQDFHSPNDAIKHKIGMVFQHFMLIPTLSVFENTILGIEPKKLGIIDEKQAIGDVEKISKDFGLEVNPKAIVGSMSVGIQQRVEIIKTLHRGAEVLILDEPTAVLTPQEVKALFKTLRKLVKQGKTIVFITHKLNEVMEISDRVTVLKKGENAGRVLTSATDEKSLARMMVGRDVVLRVKKEGADIGKTLYQVTNLSYINEETKAPILKDLCFKIQRGEILGIAGVEGNGQSELLEVLAGLKKISEGKITFKGKDITGFSVKAIQDIGIVHIPEDRQKQGLVLKNSLEDNLFIGRHNKKPFSNIGVFNSKAIALHAEKMIDEYDIRTPGKDVETSKLSGGNQQKTIIAREFSTEPEVLIISQPTRGVDVGAIEFIHQRILNMRKQGKAILLISAELQEVMSLSDRIAVMYDGEIVGCLESKDIEEEKIGLLMAGITNDYRKTP